MPAARSLATLHVRWLLLPLAAVVLAACGGGDDDTTPPPSGAMVTISGTITFDRIPFKAALNSGLNPTAPVESPARGVVVEVLDASSNAILATTTTNAAGNYTAQVAASRTVKLRAKAQMLKTDMAPIWNFRVLNNTNSDALYALDGTSFDSGTTNSTRNLRATSGWGTTSYTGTRAAAPFAILDTVYRAKELILTAAAAAVFPPLELYWSPNNRTADPFCPDLGNIGTSFYTVVGDTDNCGATPPAALPAGIYILGDLAGGNGDTDEFDQHVIAHEFGHYVEDKFGRSDSIGGSHGGGDRLDMRVAMGEGWGNAYSGMVLNDPAYRDSSGTTLDTGLNLETDGTVAEGWFSEASVGEVLWDIFDGAADAGDTVALGFTPILAVINGQQITTEALTSIFSFTAALRSANPAAAGAINALLSGENISSSDAFAGNESNAGGSTAALPVYTGLAFNQPLSICTNANFGTVNKLGYRRFLLLTLNNPMLLSFTAAGAGGSDPDIFVYRRGIDMGLQGDDRGATETTTQSQLAAGTYVVEVFDFNLTANNTSCMTVAVTGS